MGAGLKVGINKGIGCLLTSWHGFLVSERLTKAVKQISLVERFRPSGKGKHPTGQAKGGSVNEFCGGAATVDFQCCANTEENEREVIFPVSIALSCHQMLLSTSPLAAG